MSDPRDGEVICAQCRTKLNRTDTLCWRCGCRNLEPVAPPIQSEFELVLDEDPADYKWNGSELVKIK